MSRNIYFHPEIDEKVIFQENSKNKIVLSNFIQQQILALDIVQLSTRRVMIQLHR